MAKLPLCYKNSLEKFDKIWFIWRRSNIITFMIEAKWFNCYCEKVKKYFIFVSIWSLIFAKTIAFLHLLFVEVMFNFFAYSSTVVDWSFFIRQVLDDISYQLSWQRL